MSYKYAVFDIDGTIIRWQLYHAIVDELGRQGHVSAEDHQKIIVARHTWKNRLHSSSFSDYETVLVNVYHQALINLSVTDYMHAVETVFETYKDQVYTYTRDLIRKLKAENYMLFAISGSQQEIIERLGSYYGFDAVYGSVYEQVGGKFTGKRTTTYGRKGHVLKEITSLYSLTSIGSVAVGDSEADIPMLSMVEQPIAFNPSKGLFNVATTRQWKIIVERKNMVYELEPQSGKYFLAETN